MVLLSLVSMSTGDFVQVVADEEDSVYELLVRCQALTFVSVRQLRLYFGGQLLKGCHKLSFYGLQDGAQVFVANVIGVQVFNMDDFATSTYIEVHPRTHVRLLKFYAARAMGLNDSAVRLFWWGREMTNDSVLSDYDVKDGDKFHLTTYRRV
jgi:hypothetical protein